MDLYQPTIGLEIHSELKTRTKMFCDSLNDPDEKHPNQNVCPVCLGHPGTLPTINKKTVEAVIKVGLALGGRINPIVKFDRKNYFYPDLPKSYQISQYDKPIISGGELCGVRVTRVHLEEDTGRLIHETGNAESEIYADVSRSKFHASSLVDFNRAGIPLMELVTEPDIKNAAQALAFGKELQLILRYLGVSDADMEKGHMRLEANISLGKIVAGKLEMGTKVEVKNINSFKAVAGAIEYELKRQKDVLEGGERVVQETRGWDDVKFKTVSQRLKEGAHDYRYFPEPDLVPFETAVFHPEEMRFNLPELPAMKRLRLTEEFGLDEKQIETLVGDMQMSDFFEEAVSEFQSESKSSDYKILLNYLVGDLRGLMNVSGVGFEELKITPEHLAHVVLFIEQGKITSRQAKDMLKKIFETGVDPEDILSTEGGVISGEAELMRIAEEILKENEAAVSDYKKGKTASLQFLIGKAMGKLKGRGNPDTLRRIFEDSLR